MATDPASDSTIDEQAQAREAWRLADHVLDLTFAAAMRKPKPTGG